MMVTRLGFVLSLVGMALSHWGDFPAGAMIVVVFAGLPVGMIPFLAMRRQLPEIGR